MFISLTTGVGSKKDKVVVAGFNPLRHHWLTKHWLLFFSEKEGASHQETSERIYALHEGDEANRAGRVYAQRVRSHQPDPRQKGKRLLSYIVCLHFSAKEHDILKRVTPLSLTKKVSQPRLQNDSWTHGCEKIKSFAQVSLTKFLVDQIDKNVTMATSK